MSSRALRLENTESRMWLFPALALRPLYIGVAFPSILYVLAMTAFLFRPPDLFSFYADRIAFGVLLFFVCLRLLAMRESIPFLPGISLPMLGLAGLAIFRALRDPFEAQNWSIIASKYIVPFALFHFAVVIFGREKNRRHFEVFSICALAYLVFTAIAFLVNARSLIFPNFILDESLGFHADRARGPFLQAVADGMSLNILGIVVVAFCRKLTLAIFILCGLALPLAILATMTRAVWVSFAFSTVFLAYGTVKSKFRLTCFLLAAAGLVAGMALGCSNHSQKAALMDRTEESGPIQARVAVYEAGWEMFRERPLSGWAAHGMYSELGRRMAGYHLRTFYVHNTYLALLVEFGLPGLLLYCTLVANLFRLSWQGPPEECSTVSALRKFWPILLGVYLFNAFFVDMAYQFVNGLLFTVAGILCAQEEVAA